MGFFDTGGKAAKFDNAGDAVTGVIQPQVANGVDVPYTETQQTDYTTKAPKTYADGNPTMQAIIQLQTDERADDDDDGLRTLYVNKTRMKRAIQRALKDAKQSQLQIGGTLQVWMTGFEQSQGGGSPAKAFAARYYAPVGGLDVPTAVPAPAPVAAPPAPVAAPAPAAPVSAPPAPVAAPPAPVAAPPAPVAAPPAPVAAPAPPVAPPAPVAPAPPAPAAPAAPVAAPPAPAGSESDLPF